MRLAIEITTCTPSRTGIGYYTEHLVDALLATRVGDDDVVLLTNRTPAPELARRWAPHLHVTAHPVASRVRAAWMQSELPRRLAALGADLVVCPNYVVPLASPCPSLVVVHDLALLRLPQLFTLRKRALMRSMLVRSVASAQLVGTVSEASRADLIRLLGVPPERIALLPGAPHPSCGPAPQADVAAVRARHALPRPYVLTVGTLEPRKNLLTLLRAFERLGTRGAGHDLVIVGGRGWHDRELVRALEHRGDGGRVHWLGYVSERDLVALYSGADLFVYASALEGFGLPVVEAMACGAPVIASDVAALREVGGDAARFVPAGDAEALAGAIALALDDDGAARAARRAAGLARAAGFSWTRTATALWARARASIPARLPSAPRSRPERSPAPIEPPPASLTPREWALLATVEYADLFDSPLPLGEGARAIIAAAVDEPEAIRLAHAAPLSSLLRVVDGPRGRYLVRAGREALVAAMPEREDRTRALLARNRPVLGRLAALPFVRALIYSGGVVHQNPGTRADVDLFVVTAAGRAYTAYTLLFLVTKLTGTREVICPNYLVDERELTIAYHRDLFTAHQLVSAQPLSSGATYEAWCRANQAWVRDLFPAFAPRPYAGHDHAAPVARALRIAGEALLWPIGALVEGTLRFAWRYRLRRRAAGAARADVVLGAGILKLHLTDYRRRVMGHFGERLDALRARLAADAAAPARGSLRSTP